MLPKICYFGLLSTGVALRVLLSLFDALILLTLANLESPAIDHEKNVLITFIINFPKMYEHLL